ncbi:MAG: ATP-binding cassette domain-containing protein [Pedobacter sp.]|nr:MAG: ATP-binding cassette domain-containing protein [Pedobacter sp.]
MSNIAIKVEDLSKAYQLGQIGTGTINRDLERWYARVRGKEDPYLRIGESNDQNIKSKTDVVWSLKDVNFEIEQGDAVGIIGKNGAGKSTLLKILSKVTAPTTGRIAGKGRIASLLEVGTGFHPELSGRENIFLNGAILGMRKKEIQRKLEEIVNFAGVERYLDTPVKRYSSGMYVRLAFAVAAHLESEILIVDEVLAVGDAEFQKKCLGKMGDVSTGEGRTVLFVSHNLESIITLCKNSILLNKGNIQYNGNSTVCIQEYKKMERPVSQKKWNSIQVPKLPFFKEVEIDISGIQPNLILIVKISISTIRIFPKAFIAFDIKNANGTTIMQAIPNSEPFIIMDGIQKTVTVQIKLTGLIPDSYYLSAWVGPHNNETYDWQKDILSFDVLTSPIPGRTFQHTYNNGFLITESKILNFS